jgi:hypothetical protein
MLAWLRRLWRRPAAALLPPLVRDVSRLESTPDRLDAVSEVVETSGGPLKPGHLRRALRDPRLLPKRTRRDLLGRRIRYMSGDEARRLFGETLRTRDRNVSDLLPDEEQLARYGLPLWRGEADLAAALGLSVKELRFFSVHRRASRVCHYTAFTIPKRSGGQRLILAPKRRLKRLQRALLPLLIDRLPSSEQAHGFRAGRSVATNAAVHVGRAVVLQLDLQDFFPAVTFGRVRGLLIALGYGYAVAAVLAALLTEAPRQPVESAGVLYHVPVGPRHCVQGAPTSPGLCNCVCRRLDRRLAGLARAFGFAYTRYADDLTFSGEAAQRVHALRTHATRIIEEEGFRVNTAKTRVARRGSRQRVTGVTVNEVLGLSRRERRRLRAAIHQLGKGNADADRLAEVRGKLAYLAMLNPQQAEALRRHGGRMV